MSSLHCTQCSQFSHLECSECEMGYKMQLLTSTCSYKIPYNINNCDLCENENICGRCGTNYYLFLTGNICMQTCPKYSELITKEEISYCSFGTEEYFDLDSNAFIKKCNIDINCENCDATGVCKTCKEEYFLNKMTLVDSQSQCMNYLTYPAISPCREYDLSGHCIKCQQHMWVNITHNFTCTKCPSDCICNGTKTDPDCTKKDKLKNIGYFILYILILISILVILCGIIYCCCCRKRKRKYKISEIVHKLSQMPRNQSQQQYLEFVQYVWKILG